MNHRRVIVHGYHGSPDFPEPCDGLFRVFQLNKKMKMKGRCVKCYDEILPQEQYIALDDVGPICLGCARYE